MPFFDKTSGITFFFIFKSLLQKRNGNNREKYIRRLCHVPSLLKCFVDFTGKKDYLRNKNKFLVCFKEATLTIQRKRIRIFVQGSYKIVYWFKNQSHTDWYFSSQDLIEAGG